MQAYCQERGAFLGRLKDYVNDWRVLGVRGATRTRRPYAPMVGAPTGCLKG